VFSIRQGRHTVRRDEQPEISDMQIPSRDEDACIRRQADDDRNPGTYVIQYRLQRRCIE
jgi:hypothetical protein